MAVYLSNDIPMFSPVTTIRQQVETVAANNQQLNDQQQINQEQQQELQQQEQGADPLDLMEEGEVFPSAPAESSLNPLWLLLAGAALGAMAVSAYRGTK